MEPSWALLATVGTDTGGESCGGLQSLNMCESIHRFGRGPQQSNPTSLLLRKVPSLRRQDALVFLDSD